jgi:Protein of unknown function (DUF3298)
MRKVYFFLFFGLLAGFWECRQSAEQGPLTLKKISYQFVGEGQCDTTKNRGVSVAAQYFQLVGELSASRSINDSLLAMVAGGITSWVDSAALAQTPAARRNLNAGAKLFSDSYQQMGEEGRMFGGCWDLQITCDSVFTSAAILTVRQETYVYSGGAHPNTHVTFQSFSRQTGHALQLTEVVSDTTALLKLVEQAFRKEQQIRPEQNLEEAGYFLRDGQFFLPETFGIGRDGLIFLYNPYEIAAYAVGPISVTVPYDRLKKILREGVCQ